MDAAWYRGRLYLCTSSRLYELKYGEIKETEFPADNTPSSFGYLYANAGLPMSAGPYSIAIYDGTNWNMIHGKSSFSDEDAALSQKMIED